MNLTPQERQMLEGKRGKSLQKAMQILLALGKIYGAERMIPVSSVQIAGVSYANLGQAGLDFLQEMADGGGKAQVLATLNPAGMDIENWQKLGISQSFARNQNRVIKTFARMGVLTTCTCTPYLSGNVPHYGEHIAWSESSAVCYANSVLGAHTNREGGPSALASALTGLTPEYGYHIVRQRLPQVCVDVKTALEGSIEFGALGKAMSEKMPAEEKQTVAYIRGVQSASLEQLKALCASTATFAGTALFHMEGITPEASLLPAPLERVEISRDDIERAIQSMSDAEDEEIDFISLGCPHLSIKEVKKVAEIIQGKCVKREFWVTTSRAVKDMADRMGYTDIIEKSGAKIAADTCCVVAPIKGRFKGMMTDSAKACYYASAKNRFKTNMKPFEEVVRQAVMEGEREKSV